MAQTMAVSGAGTYTTSGRGTYRVSGSHHYITVVAAALFLSGVMSSETAALSETASTHSIVGSTATAEDAQRFSLLAEQWKKERGVTSSVTAMVLCPSYQRVIAMGDKAVPLILRAIEDEGADPDHWFWALEIITGSDPVPMDAYGDTVMMARAWLDWAQGRYAW